MFTSQIARKPVFKQSTAEPVCLLEQFLFVKGFSETTEAVASKSKCVMHVVSCCRWTHCNTAYYQAFGIKLNQFPLTKLSWGIARFIKNLHANFWINIPFKILGIFCQRLANSSTNEVSREIDSVFKTSGLHYICLFDVSSWCDLILWHGMTFLLVSFLSKITKHSPRKCNVYFSVVCDTWYYWYKTNCRNIKRIFNFFGVRSKFI